MTIGLAASVIAQALADQRPPISILMTIRAIIWNFAEPDSAGGEQFGYTSLYALTEDICVGRMIVVTGDGESEHILV